MQPMVPRAPAEHDRVDRRPQRRRRAAGARLPAPATRRSSGRPRSRRASTRHRRSAPRSTLWDQAGCSVIRGNLIVVPVGGSFVYLEPIYLQLDGRSKLPAFQRIVVASSTTWSGRRPRGACAEQVLGRAGRRWRAGPSPSPTPYAVARSEPPPGPSAPRRGPSPSQPATSPRSSAYADSHFGSCRGGSTATGDFATYGQELALVRQALVQLDALTGGVLPSGAPSAPSAPPAPSPSPAP